MTRTSRSSQDSSKSNSNRSKNSRKDKKTRTGSYSSSPPQDYQQHMGTDPSQGNQMATATGYSGAHPSGSNVQTQYGATPDPVDYYSMNVETGSDPNIDDSRAVMQGQSRRERQEYAIRHQGVQLTQVPRRNSNSSQIKRVNVAFGYPTYQGHPSTYAPQLDMSDSDETGSHSQASQQRRRSSGGSWKY